MPARWDKNVNGTHRFKSCAASPGEHACTYKNQSITLGTIDASTPLTCGATTPIGWNNLELLHAKISPPSALPFSAPRKEEPAAPFVAAFVAFATANFW